MWNYEGPCPLIQMHWKQHFDFLYFLGCFTLLHYSIWVLHLQNQKSRKLWNTKFLAGAAFDKMPKWTKTWNRDPNHFNYTIERAQNMLYLIFCITNSNDPRILIGLLSLKFCLIWGIVHGTRTKWVTPIYIFRFFPSSSHFGVLPASDFQFMQCLALPCFYFYSGLK